MIKKMSEQGRKKIVKLDHGMGEEADYYIVGEEDSDKTIRDIILEVAEEMETRQDDASRMEATRLRGLLQTHNIYIKGNEISPEARIGDLNWDVEMVEDENAFVASINLQRQQTGGSKKKLAGL